MCYRRGEDTVSDATLPMSKPLLETMQRNRQTMASTSAYWQYYGTEEGIFVTYPEKYNSHCTNYDPRYRQVDQCTDAHLHMAKINLVCQDYERKSINFFYHYMYIISYITTYIISYIITYIISYITTYIITYIISYITTYIISYCIYFFTTYITYFITTYISSLSRWLLASTVWVKIWHYLISGHGMLKPQVPC